MYAPSFEILIHPYRTKSVLQSSPQFSSHLNILHGLPFFCLYPFKTIDLLVWGIYSGECQSSVYLFLISKALFICFSIQKLCLSASQFKSSVYLLLNSKALFICYSIQKLCLSASQFKSAIRTLWLSPIKLLFVQKCTDVFTWASTDSPLLVASASLASFCIWLCVVCMSSSLFWLGADWCINAFSWILDTLYSQW